MGQVIRLGDFSHHEACKKGRGNLRRREAEKENLSIWRTFFIGP